jgi:hypothetical protein
MAISLEKRAEKVGIILAKHGITKVPPVRVGCALDVSGSTRDLYDNGIIQETMNRLMGVALKFDDNGELDMWAFSNGVAQLDTATAADAETYVNKKLLKAQNLREHMWSGTSYGPVLEAVVKYYFPSTTASVSGFFGSLFGKKAAPASDLPAMLLLVTDGANDDQYAAARVLEQAANKSVYFMMVGVGPEHLFGFIKEQADLLPNVGFVNLNSLALSDDDLYEQLVSGEFASWVKSHS